MKQKSKKRTIFFILVIPLIIMMFLQSCIMSITIIAKGTTRQLKDYSVSTLAKTVENRKLTLENDMTQRWAAVRQYESSLNERLTAFLKEKNITIEEFQEQDGLKEEALDFLLEDCVSIAQSNLTTGIFLILTDESAGEGKYHGFYIRDSEPFSAAINDSDLLMERGNKELSRKYNIPLDIYWTTYFRMADKGESAADEYFYEPWEAGEKYPDNPVDDLGKWTTPFVLEDDERDSYEMITYSLPLRYEGKVYAVLGIEVSVDFLLEYFPLAELNDAQHAGYMLAIDHGDGTYTPFLGKGMLYSDVVKSGENFQLNETEYGNLYEISDVKLGNRSLYAVNCPLNLYNTQAPYEDTEWVLLGINTEKDLFGISRQLYVSVMISVLIGLVFGVVAINLLLRILTNPLKRLAGSISRGMEGLEAYKPSNVLEIESIYEVVNDLFKRQKEVENALLEEKELYRMVLESAQEQFFLYDLKKNTVEIVSQNGEYPNWSDDILDGETGFVKLSYIYEEDHKKVRRLWKDVEEEATAEFRFQRPNGECQWYSVRGRIFCDIEGNRSKVLGSFRNIQKQKELEASQEKRSITDGVTGFYTYNAGMQFLNEIQQETTSGVFCYFRFRNLREVGENNGPVFGDMILEAIGEIIIDALGLRGFAIRLSHDQIVAYLEEADQAAGKAFAKKVCDAVDQAFPAPVFSLTFSGGVALDDKTANNGVLVCRAKLAEKYGFRHMLHEPVAYEELPKKSRRRLSEVFLQSRQVHTDAYLKETSLVSLALNLFAKGDDLSAQMFLLLKKMAAIYGAEHIYITIVRPDFNSSYLEYQWHKDHREMEHVVNGYKEEDFEAYTRWLGERLVCPYSEADSSRREIGKFTNASAGSSGIVMPLYDGSFYVGALCMEGAAPSLSDNPDEKQNLQETASVIQSQINQKRHDLASKAKSDFLSRMSHEIRTPMNGIIGMTAIAIKNQDDPQRVSDCLYKIKGSSDYLLGLINDILDMSKIESGKMHLEPVDFDMREMLDNIIELISPQAKEKQIDFVKNIVLNHTGFHGDKLRISQVLINLLGNAVKFTLEQGKVVLTVIEQEEEAENTIFFAVQDTGRGIAEEDQKKIFQLFEQGSLNAGETKRQGTGLGLSISRSLVRMMGSDIELESEIGEGSTFSFEIALPVVSLSESREQMEEVSFEGCRVLVVEDNELNSEIARNILEEAGFRVDCVFDGKEAVEQIKNTPPGTYDVVLMDIMMPVMDGLEATRAIRAMNREDSRTLPIIAMSANAFDDDLKKSVECGMNGHLSKPVEVDKLYRTLAEVVKK